MSPTSQKYKFAAIAADVVIFTLKQGELQVLLIKMKKHPFEKCWAAPGGLVKPMESVEAAARKQLALKTGVKNIYLEQLYTFGEVKRDPFGRVVSVAYFALIPSDSVTLHTTKEYADVRWFPVKKLPVLAYDHTKIIDTAIRRLQSKMGYTNIVCNLLPKVFSLSELQGVYEIILNKHFDKRNFRKKILSLKLVKPMGKKREGEANRPAQLYTFTNRSISQAEIM